MKTGALILFTILLIDAFTPANAQAATELRGAQQADPAAEAAIQSLHAQVVSVTLGNELDLNKLAPGLYTYVVFNLNEAESAAMGRIVSFESNRHRGG